MLDLTPLLSLLLYPGAHRNFLHLRRVPREKREPRRHVEHGEQLALAHRAPAHAREHHVVHFADKRVIEAEALQPAESRGLEFEELEARTVARQNALEHRDDLIRLHLRAKGKVFRLAAAPG